ncbi:hypothetical protein NIES23_44290 [Trichormus variabilis NIES-23]|uniref:Uncharacterized protein n=1 Tax=Trichormus variabilis NIES-23 TaxID=1973479 RepID=A0A1Z4KRJ0_ANAVA|nr:hypothetical protein NIES23_44290 [Trichormus variabilis NIES-23]
MSYFQQKTPPTKGYIALTVCMQYTWTSLLQGVLFPLRGWGLGLYLTQLQTAIVFVGNQFAQQPTENIEVFIQEL